jgi:hypothetical protein
MRFFQAGFATAFLVLVLSFCAASLLASHGSAKGRSLSDDSLARVLGANGGQIGSATANYSCDNVNATGVNQYTQTGCSNLTTIPRGAQCVDCLQVSGVGYSSGTTTKVDFAQVLDCTNGGKGSNLGTADCIMGASGHGVCDYFTPTGQCTGSFNQFDQQDVTPP